MRAQLRHADRAACMPSPLVTSSSQWHIPQSRNPQLPWPYIPTGVSADARGWLITRIQFNTSTSATRVTSAIQSMMVSEVQVNGGLEENLEMAKASTRTCGFLRSLNYVEVYKTIRGAEIRANYVYICVLSLLHSIFLFSFCLAERQI